MVVVVAIGVTCFVEVVMLMGMSMGMLVLVDMGVGMGNAVMGVLVSVGMFVGMGVVAVAHMIVMNMHNRCSFLFFLYYSGKGVECQNIYFADFIPMGGLRYQEKGGIIGKTQEGGLPMGEHHHEHDHAHGHCHDHDHAYMHAHGIAHSHGHVHENQKAVVNRLARAIGHLEKVKRMVEEGYDCSEVLVQLAAVRSALDNTGKVILQDHLRHCMVDAVAAGDEAAIDELCQAIDKFMK